MTSFQDRLTALRREFHRHPELGFQEDRTKAKVAAHLRGLGLEVHEGAGVVGLLRAGTGNRAIGLRADMDAPEVTAHIDQSLRLAELLGFTGTPSFVIGDALVPGFVEVDELERLVSAARGAN